MGRGTNPLTRGVSGEVYNGEGGGGQILHRGRGVDERGGMGETNP